MGGRLEGKVCVITGAASGIGAETARLFAEEGARVVGVDLAEGAEGELALQADVAEEDSVRDMYAKAAEEMGRIDVLFNNAGISPDDDVSVLDTSLDAWQRVQDVNLKSVFLCCKHGIPHLLEAGGGSVINTASFVAVMGAATSQISYTASKGGCLRYPGSWAWNSASGASGSTRSAPARSTRRCCRSSSRRTRRRPRAAWSICRWAVSPRPGRSLRASSSSPPTTAPT